MTKKKVRRPMSLHERAHSHASRMKAKAPTEWNKEEKGTYWWGVFDGYIAGTRSARRTK
jgi:hypothetical protein